MVFQWGVSDSKSPQVSRTLLSIQAVLSNAIVSMVSTRPLTSKSSSPFINPLVTVPRAPITIGMNVTFMFHRFFNSQKGPGIYPSFHFLLILLCGQPGKQSPLLCKFSFLLITIRSGRLAEIRWSLCMSKSQRNLCVSFSGTGAGLCKYHLFVW